MASSTPSQKAVDQKNAEYDKNKTVIIGADGNQEHQKAAEKKIVSELREKNHNETTFNFHLLGDLSWAPGKVVALDSSFGVFQGNYLMDKVIHRIGRQGFTTEIEGHKALKGHDAGKAPAKTGKRPYSAGSVFTPTESGSPTPLAAQLGAPPPTTVAQASRR